MHAARFSCVVGLIVAAGCGAAAALDAPVPVRDVVVLVDLRGRCLVGACDPIALDRPTLALVRLVNRGTDTSYIAMCGPQPALAEQQWIDGQWQFSGPADACVNGPPSMALAPGDSMLTNWWPPTGLSRLMLGVGPTSSFRDMQEDVSNAVRVP